MGAADFENSYFKILVFLKLDIEYEMVHLEKLKYCIGMYITLSVLTKFNFIEHLLAMCSNGAIFKSRIVSI